MLALMDDQQPAGRQVCRWQKVPCQRTACRARSTRCPVWVAPHPVRPAAGHRMVRMIATRCSDQHVNVRRHGRRRPTLPCCLIRRALRPGRPCLGRREGARISSEAGMSAGQLEPFFDQARQTRSCCTASALASVSSVSLRLSAVFMGWRVAGREYRFLYRSSDPGRCKGTHPNGPSARLIVLNQLGESIDLHRLC